MHIDGDIVHDATCIQWCMEGHCCAWYIVNCSIPVLPNLPMLKISQRENYKLLEGWETNYQKQNLQTERAA